MSNTLAYYIKQRITAVKRVIVLALSVYFIKPFIIELRQNKLECLRRVFFQSTLRPKTIQVKYWVAAHSIGMAPGFSHK